MTKRVLMRNAKGNATTGNFVDRDVAFARVPTNYSVYPEEWTVGMNRRDHYIIIHNYRTVEFDTNGRLHPEVLIALSSVMF